MDLDTRPPEMRRSTMSHWVHECEECGYVAPELDKTGGTDAKRVATADYRQALGRNDRTRLANRFVCRALLEEAAGDLVSAGWRLLHAAWACDDAEQAEEARVQRMAALALFERGRALAQRAMKSVAGGDELLLADIARRAGEFHRALEYCAAGLALPEVPAFVTSLLMLQQELIRARDTARHTVAEAEEAPRGGTVQ
jgi:glutathione S-transferase